MQTEAIPTLFNKSASSIERQMWCENAVKAFRSHFAECGYAIPDNVRVSVGIPKGQHGSKKAIGQCWSDKVSADGHYEIFTSPEQGREVDHLETIAHELVHATAGTEAGHKGLFKLCALAVGFKMPMTTTPADTKMSECIKRIINSIGYYPAGALDIIQRKKKGTYMLKCACPACDYVVYTTQKHLQKGDPICPVDGSGMN